MWEKVHDIPEMELIPRRVEMKYILRNIYLKIDDGFIFQDFYEDEIET